MKKQDIAKAFKDERFRDSLSAEERAAMPDNPAGLVELSDETLLQVVGGFVAQTGTGGDNCSCVITQTATSGLGKCNCLCDDGTETQQGHTIDKR